MPVALKFLRNDPISFYIRSIVELSSRMQAAGRKAIKYLFILIQQNIFHQTMGYSRFIQVGRVARINYGPQEGKLATIVDIITDKRVLIDGEDIERQTIPIRRLQLTKEVLKIGRGIRSGKLRKFISKENVQKKFNQSSIGQAYSRQARRQQLTDFQRFKVLALRRKLSKLVRAKQNKKK